MNTEQLQKLRDAGWSPDSLRRALLDDNDDEDWGHQPAVTAHKQSGSVLPAPMNKENCQPVRTQHTSSSSSSSVGTSIRSSRPGTGVVIDLTSESPPSRGPGRCSNHDIDQLVGKFNQQSLHCISPERTKIGLPVSRPHSSAGPYSSSTISSSTVTQRPALQPLPLPPPPPASTPASAPASTPASAPVSTLSTLPVPLEQYEALLRAANLDEPLPNGWHLFAHQRQAIADCLRLRRTIMAFDMGLGKTIIGLIWAKAVATVVPGCLTVVVVPCTLIEVWRREAVMIGFDVHGQGTLASRFSIAIYSWAKMPTPAEVGRKYLLIADEAHAMQSLTSQRTQAALRLCADAACMGCILSSGTPLRNGRPANIYPLLVGIRHPVARNKLEFERKYCNARKTKFCPWDITGASNLAELRTTIGPYLMRKTKEECLDIPLLTRRSVKVDVGDDDQAEYDTILADMKQQVKASHVKGNGAKNGCALSMMSELRALVSKAKVPGTAAVVREELRRCADPVVVFVWFKAPVALLMAELCGDGESVSSAKGVGSTEHTLPTSSNTNTSTSSSTSSSTSTAARSHPPSPLRCESLTGDIVKNDVRSGIVDRFQRGEIDVLIVTYGVGSTGITLTRSHTVVLMDRPWTPGDAAQAEDRVRRIGPRASTVDSIWIEAFSLDVKLDTMLAAKASNTAKVLVLPSQSHAQTQKNVITQSKRASSAAAPPPTKTIKDFFKGTAVAVNDPTSATARASAEVLIPTHPSSVPPSATSWFGDSEQEVESESIMSVVLKGLLQ